MQLRFCNIGYTSNLVFRMRKCCIRAGILSRNARTNMGSRRFGCTVCPIFNHDN
ncbi:hypothetical protein BDQ94DRAFT_136971 [Aspergillus welwitschiae]|uniref:Uncharacterized protein n=1 Tax=Aspergillus welwitschiae TaxID=1341132 RepID=A0A3F3QC50_9EURO|nr:hypothetical protein BDQ94DRAFT_136971 [Aspergillus welwitschiae]RDH36844.1 hypothetical protein BDQ94DRAFT_136971 [Aspergillus welwitschiae]